MRQRKSISPDSGPRQSEFRKHHQFIADEAEAFNILVGRVAFLAEPVHVFVRLDEGCDLGELTETDLPTRCELGFSMKT